MKLFVVCVAFVLCQIVVAQLSTWPDCISLCEDFPCKAAEYPKTSCILKNDEFAVSGLVFHPTLNQLVGVDDDDKVFFLDADKYSVVDTIDLKQADWGNSTRPTVLDLEAVTFVDETTNIIYVGAEQICRGATCPCTTPCSAILEFDFKANKILREFDLSDLGNDATHINQGLEALTFVPDSNFKPGAPSGTFLVGVQQNGDLKSYRILFGANAKSELYKAAEKFELGRDNKNDRIDDVSAVDFDRSTGLVVSLYAQHHVLAIGKADGCLLRSFALPNLGNNQLEGVAIRKKADGQVIVYLADDGAEKESGGVFPFDFTCIFETLPAECYSKGVYGALKTVEKCENTSAGTIRVHMLLGIAALVGVLE